MTGLRKFRNIADPAGSVLELYFGDRARSVQRALGLAEVLVAAALLVVPPPIALTLAGALFLSFGAAAAVAARRRVGCGCGLGTRRTTWPEVAVRMAVGCAMFVVLAAVGPGDDGAPVTLRLALFALTAVGLSLAVSAPAAVAHAEVDDAGRGISRRRVLAGALGVLPAVLLGSVWSQPVLAATNWCWEARIACFICCQQRCMQINAYEECTRQCGGCYTACTQGLRCIHRWQCW